MRHDDGSVTAELVLLAPVLLLLMAFVVMTGRIGEVRGAVVHGAHQAARAASLRADAAQAETNAQAVAAANLAQLDVTCSDLTVSVDTTRFHRGGDVAVTVRCAVDLSDLGFAGLPGSRTVEARAVEVIDSWRGGS